MKTITDFMITTYNGNAIVRINTEEQPDKSYYNNITYSGDDLIGCQSESDVVEHIIIPGLDLDDYEDNDMKSRLIDEMRCTIVNSFDGLPWEKN